jgi:hypothetical protein
MPCNMVVTLGGLENFRRFGSQRLSLPVSLALEMRGTGQPQHITRSRY